MLANKIASVILSLVSLKMSKDDGESVKAKVIMLYEKHCYQPGNEG